MRRKRKRVRRSGRLDLPAPLRHGTRGGYSFGCRCPACVVAEKRWVIARTQGWTGHYEPADEAREMLREMTKRDGWSVREVAEEIDRDYSGLYRILRGTTKRVQSAVLEDIRALAERQAIA